MPNMVADGLLIEAITIHGFASQPSSGDLSLQNAVQAAINAAALTGVFTTSLSVAAYSNTYVQALIKRLIDMGYGASLATNTLTVTW